MTEWPLGIETDRELRTLGFIEYFAFARDRSRRLDRLGGEARVLFAVSSAERAITWEEGLPENEQRPYPLSWRPTVDRMWDWIRGDDTARDDVARVYSEFLTGPYSDDDPDGPGQEADSMAAVAIYAAGCCRDMSAADADAGAIHLVDELFFAGERDEAWISGHRHLSDDIRGVAHPLVQRELQRQQQALDLLETQSFSERFADPPPPEIVGRLRAAAEVTRPSVP